MENISWSFTSVLCIILAVICLLIYVKSKQKEFLYYGLYNFILCTYVFLKTPYFPEFIREYIYSTNLVIYNYYSQSVYIFFLFMFYMYFIDVNINYPKSYKAIKIFLLVLVIIFTLLFIGGCFTDIYILYKTLFLYAFLPCAFVLTIYLIYLFFSKKTKTQLGIFSIIGVILYNVFAYIALLKTHLTDEASPIVYFYYGICLESIVFIFGLGYKINLLYEAKQDAQYTILKEQKRLNKIQENYQRNLEKRIEEREIQLLESQKLAEEIKIEGLKKDYLAQIKTLHLKSLQSQMNPHFIFNALNSIKVYLIENKKNEAIFYLNKFSKLIRKILESSRIDFHSLEEELEIIELYLNIENIRFENQIELKLIRENTRFDNVKVPSLFLQPFIENTIWHGFKADQTNKKISIHITKKERGAEVLLIDNGIGRKAAKLVKSKKTIKRKSVGLEMTKDRFNYFNQKYDFQYDFHFIDLCDEYGKALGTKVVFSLFS